MGNKLTAAIACVALAASAQVPERRGSLKIDLPKDSPLALVSADWGESSATPRGSAVVLDLHTSLQLRNATQKRVRGVTLIVLAQDLTPGGKASISVPSIDVAPGETFPVKVDVRLLRPASVSSGPVQVGIDGVLFDDLSFFGPNKLGSRRSMTVWELEARRDRKYFRAVLEKAGNEGLQKEMLLAIGRQTDRPQTGMQVVRGRATNMDAERDVQFAFLQFPNAPVEPKEGLARIAGNEARAPRLEVRNRSEKQVRYLEIGWLVQDHTGREFLAGSVPAELNLAPGQSGQVLQDSMLRFPERRSINSMTGFVSTVEYGDGSIWIPDRQKISDVRLANALAPSPEEQRLIQIYRKRGLQALIDELKKF